jgi:hypothetical protein
MTKERVEIGCHDQSPRPILDDIAGERSNAPARERHGVVVGVDEPRVADVVAIAALRAQPIHGIGALQAVR